MKKMKLFSIGFVTFLVAFFVLNLLPIPFFVQQGVFPFDQNVIKYCSLNFWYCYSDFGGTVSNFPKTLESSTFSLFILPIFLPFIFSVIIVRKFFMKK